MFDLAIIGSGFAGSILAMIARRLGRKVVLLERTRHPRFAIGESSTPLANLLLREVATRYDLPRLRPLTRWGEWQKAYPRIGCGLKRGFSFFEHKEGQPFRPEAAHANQLLVAANVDTEHADTHWYRPDFDHFLVEEAQRLGAELVDEMRLEEVSVEPSGLVVRGTRAAETLKIKARFIVDASGPRGFLHQQFNLGEPATPSDTVALFSHFRSVHRLEDLPHFPRNEAPFPIDDAAVHHALPGGWIWVLRFNNGITSAGVAARRGWAERFQFVDGAPGWDRLIQHYPSVAKQFQDASTIEPFRYLPRLGFRSARVVGPQWALLPSAAGFVDPLLSTGFPLTLLGILRLGRVLEKSWRGESVDKELSDYERQTFSEFDAARELVDTLYLNMDRFGIFTAVSLLYFAAAIWNETAWRLGKSRRARSFLLHDDPRFGPAAAASLQYACQRSADWSEQKALVRIVEATAPINLASLGDPRFGNWYPVTLAGIAQADEKFRAASEV